jgi:hypothetical protein
MKEGSGEARYERNEWEKDKAEDERRDERKDRQRDRAPKGGASERSGKWRPPKHGPMRYHNVYSSTRPELEVERIDRERINARGVNEFLVKWYGYVDKEQTWEPITNITHADSMIADWHARNENLRSCPRRRPFVDDSSPEPAENSLPETPTTRRMTRSQAHREI